MIGLFGVISYGVSQRTHEIGVRSALGAAPRSILLMILREAMTLVVAGIAIGIAAGLALGRVLESLLFEIKAGDPLVRNRRRRADPRRANSVLRARPARDARGPDASAALRVAESRGAGIRGGFGGGTAIPLVLPGYPQHRKSGLRISCCCEGAQLGSFSWV